jgi:hypothetical protein
MPKNKISELDVCRITKVYFAQYLIDSNIDALIKVGLIRQKQKQKVNRAREIFNEISQKFWIAYNKDEDKVEQTELYKVLYAYDIIGSELHDLNNYQVFATAMFIKALKEGAQEFNLPVCYLEFKHYEMLHAVNMNLQTLFEFNPEYKVKTLIKNKEVTGFNLKSLYLQGEEQIEFEDIFVEELYALNQELYGETIKYETGFVDIVLKPVIPSNEPFTVGIGRNRYNDITSIREVIVRNVDEIIWVPIIKDTIMLNGVQYYYKL